jgi:daunorubicin resistance ABC transporter ATP-binding subunit
MNGDGHGSAGVAVEVSGLVKSFGATRALAGVDLAADPGRVLALLGPNGAGKTTLVRIIATLLRPDAGSARVGGLDVVANAATVRPLIGLTGQFAAIDDLLTGRENLEMVGELCQLGRAEARRRAAALLAQVSLEDAADRLARTYSGGMRRRLDLAASLIGKPPLLVLDEPTTGLDPRTRADLWTMIAGLATGGTTVLLTTQYLEEADRLAHRVVVLDRGEVAAEGTPAELKARLGGTVVELHAAVPGSFGAALAAVRADGEAAPAADPGRGRITVPAPDGARTLRAVLDRLDAAGVGVDDIGLRQPSLDEVFLALTGHGAAAPVPVLADGRAMRAGRRRSR